jgi:hypothetical protein
MCSARQSANRVATSANSTVHGAAAAADVPSLRAQQEDALVQRPAPREPLPRRDAL